MQRIAKEYLNVHDKYVRSIGQDTDHLDTVSYVRAAHISNHLVCVNYGKGNGFRYCCHDRHPSATVRWMMDQHYELNSAAAYRKSLQEWRGSMQAARRARISLQAMNTGFYRLSHI